MIECKFLNLFEGRELRRGTIPSYHHQLRNGPDAKTGKFKIEGPFCKKEAPSIGSVKAHLNGEEGWASYPVLKDGTVKFCALDYDEYFQGSYKEDIWLERYRELSKQLVNLPIILCKTKSGGLHCYSFFKEPVKLDACHKFLDYIQQSVGLPGPWERRPIERTVSETGSAISLPYFGGDTTGEKQAWNFAVYNGEKLGVREFLDLADEKRVDMSQESVVVKEIKNNVSLLDGAPPCLKTIQQLGGFAEKRRNNGMTRLIVYWILRANAGGRTIDADTIYKELQLKYAPVFCGGPRPERELRSSIDKYLEYWRESEQDPNSFKARYACSSASDVILAPHCDKDICKRCKFGRLSKRTQATCLIEHMVLWEGEPELLEIFIDGKSITMNLEDAGKVRGIEGAFWKQHKIYHTLPSAIKWREELNIWSKKWEVRQQEEENTELGLFRSEVHSALMGLGISKNNTILMSGGVLDKEDGFLYFKYYDLIKRLQDMKCRWYMGNTQETSGALRSIGCKSARCRLTGTNPINSWTIPEFREPTQISTNDVPVVGGFAPSEEHDIPM